MDTDCCHSAQQLEPAAAAAAAALDAEEAVEHVDPADDKEDIPLDVEPVERLDAELGVRHVILPALRRNSNELVLDNSTLLLLPLINCNRRTGKLLVESEEAPDEEEEKWWCCAEIPDVVVVERWLWWLCWGMGMRSRCQIVTHCTPACVSINFYSNTTSLSLSLPLYRCATRDGDSHPRKSNNSMYPKKR